jgi:hypothetical protein
MRGWKLNRGSIGLWAMSIAYASGHELDGHIDLEWVETKLPRAAERNKIVGALVESGLWEVNGDGWIVHDFLVYNPSAEELAERRRAEAERKAKKRAEQAARESGATA